MRNELSKIELTELYLLGQMNEADKLAFEQQMKQDEELDEDVKLQALLMESIALSAFTAEMAAMHDKLAAPKGKGFGKLFWFGLSGLAIFAVTASFFLFANENHTEEKNNLTSIATSSENSGSEVAQIDFTNDFKESGSASDNGTTPFYNEGRNQNRNRRKAKTPVLTDNGIRADRERFLPTMYREKMDPSKDFTFQMTDSKSRVFIPANSILDATGKPAKGEVEIRYREYRDAADMAFSGIPMIQRENGEDFNFNSAGMFEINAYQDGEKLALNPEKPIKIDFNLTQELDELYFWELNGDTWKKDGLISFSTGRGAVPVNKRDSVDVAMSKKIVKENLRNKPSKFVVNLSTTSGDELKRRNIKVKLKRNSNDWDLVASKEYKVLSDSGWVITGSHGADTEMKIYVKGYKRLTIKDLDTEDGAWSTISAKFQPKRKRGIVGKIGRKLSSEERKQLMKIKGSYVIDRNVGKFPVDTSIYSYDSTYRQRVPSDSILSYQPGQGYVAMEKMVYGLRLRNFGTFNCDQLYRLENLVGVNSTFKDEKGNLISGSGTLSVVSKQINGAFTYSQNSFASSNKKTVLLLFTSDKKIYAMKEKDFDAMKLQNSGSYEFVMKDMTATLKDSGDLKKFLGL